MIDKFIETLKKQETPLMVKRLCEKERELIVKKRPNLCSLKNAFTAYRNCLKETVGPNYEVKNQSVLYIALSILRLSTAEQKEFSARKKKQITIEQSNLRPIYDVDGYINKAIALLDTSEPIKMAVGLCALTGRRLAEIFSTAKFEKAEDNNHVLFSGQLKAKNSRELIAYKIPTLYDASIIITTLKKLRVVKKDYTTISLNEIHDLISWRVNKIYKDHFKGFYPEPLKPKDMRALYATICYAKNPDERISDQVFYSRILGHGENDIDTAGSYKDFYIPAQKQPKL